MDATQINCLTVLEVQSPKWALLGKSQGVGRTTLPPEVLEDNSFPCLYQHLEVMYIPCFLVPSSISNTSNPIIPTSPLTLTLLFHSFMFKDPCDDTGPNLIIQENLPISRPLIRSHLQNLLY